MFIMLGTFFTAFPQTQKCACGSFSSGKTIEYSIIAQSGTPDCCGGQAVGVNNAYAFTWEPAKDGSYVMTGATTYPTSAAAQKDCCDDDAA